MKLSDHFALDEFTYSETAEQLELSNDPSPDVVEALRYGAIHVLDRIRGAVGGPVFVTSGARTVEVNAAVGGARNSQHLRGEAADIQAPGVDRVELWAVIRNLVLTGEAPIDQAILYEKPTHGSIHVSWAVGRSPRGELRVMLADPPKDGPKTVLWHRYAGPLKPVVAPSPAPAPPEPLSPAATTAKEAPMTFAPVVLSQLRRKERNFRHLALRELDGARGRALDALSDGRLTRDEVDEQLADLLHGAARIGAERLDEAVRLPAGAEELSDEVLDFLFDLAGEALLKLAKGIVAWVDDTVGPDADRLARRIAELADDDAEDGIIGDDRPRKMYRLCSRMVRVFPEAAQGLRIRFEGAQLIFRGEPWGEPLEGYPVPQAA